MRRLFAFIAVSIDGYHEGPERELDWHNAADTASSGFPAATGFPILDDPDQDEVDALMFGRITYELLAGFWPTSEATEAYPQVAARMNSLPKYVVTRTLDHPVWNNTTVISDDVIETLGALKSGPGKDIAILGSSTLTASLISDGIVDELRILVNPTILGNGNPVLRSTAKTNPSLTSARTFPSGNVLLAYNVAEGRS